jgi:hypothetical protein
MLSTTKLDFTTNIIHNGQKAILPYVVGINEETFSQWSSISKDIAGELESRFVRMLPTLNPNAMPQFLQALPDCFSVDFAITAGEDSEMDIQLIEAQAFPSLMHTVLHWESKASQNKSEVEKKEKLLRHWVNGGDTCTIMLDKNPFCQSSGMDFLFATKDAYPVSLDQIFSIDENWHVVIGNKVRRITRIYNRIIYHTLEFREKEKLQGLMRDTSITWASHPFWFYNINKGSLRGIVHRNVPPTVSPSHISNTDLSQWVIKPKSEFSGAGVILDPTLDDLNSVSDETHIAQKKVRYAPSLQCPITQTMRCIEIRFMLIKHNFEWNVLGTLLRIKKAPPMTISHQSLIPGEGVTTCLPQTAIKT